MGSGSITRATAPFPWIGFVQPGTTPIRVVKPRVDSPATSGPIAPAPDVGLRLIRRWSADMTRS